MIPLAVDYASPSVLRSERERALLGLCANGRRPVRFHGRVVKGVFLLRTALRALGEVIWSDDTWGSAAEAFTLDPIVTVHPDRLWLEAFSLDQSVYASVEVDRELFEDDGATRTGTTNVDFTAWLWAALAEMRSSRETWLRVEPEGFEVATTGGGGRYEGTVEVPTSWVRGFLELQGAMAMPGTRLEARPVDLLSALRFLRYTKAKVSPRALRYVLEPGKEARLVLEPWEHEVILRGCEHGYDQTRTIRLWGRRRLQLLDPLLPFAEGLTIFLKGRALPSFYQVRLPGISFLLGLTGWTGKRWTDSGGFSLLAGEPTKGDRDLEGRALDLLSERYAMSSTALAEALGVGSREAEALGARLCRLGRASFDVARRELRHRELFDQPIDEAAVYPPSPRVERARAILASGEVRVDECAPQETRKVRRLKTPNGPVTREVVYRDWKTTGGAGGVEPVEIVTSETDRIIFGACQCSFFKEHLLGSGPCEHMIALFEASRKDRKDLPSSAPAEAPVAPERGDEDLDAEEQGP